MPPSRFWLLTRDANRYGGYSLPLGEHFFGRYDLQDHFAIGNDTVNISHLLFVCSEASCTVEDRSVRGTRHNGRLLAQETPVHLTDGDLLAIGEDGGFTTDLEFVDEVRRSVRQQADQWWTQWVGGTGKMPKPRKPPDAAPLFEHSSVFLLHHLPEIIRQEDPNSFTHRFLALFEQVLLPLRWQAAHFDLFLDGASSPQFFLPWLAQWYCVAVDDTWSEPQRRQLLASAPYIFARQGTAAALSKVLEIYTGVAPQIEDGGEQPRGQFLVQLPACGRSKEELLAVIDAHKPIHSSCRIVINDG